MAKSAKSIEAGNAFVRLFTDDSALRAGLKSSGKLVKEFGAGIAATGGLLTGMGASLTAPLLGAAAAFVSAGSAINEASRRTGVAVESLTALGFAAEQSGTNMETLENGLKKMSGVIVGAMNGAQGATDTLNVLGLQIEELAGLSPDEQFRRMADGVSKIHDPTLRTAMAMEIFGKAGADLIPLMSNGAAGIAQMEAEARRLGLVMSTEDAQAAAALGDAFNSLTAMVRRITMAVGGALAPAMQKVAEVGISLAQVVSLWVNQNRELVVTVATAGGVLIALGTVVTTLGGVVMAAGAVIGAFSTALGAVGTIASVVVGGISLIGSVVMALPAIFTTAAAVGTAAMAAISSAVSICGGVASVVIGLFGTWPALMSTIWTVGVTAIGGIISMLSALPAIWATIGAVGTSAMGAIGAATASVTAALGLLMSPAAAFSALLSTLAPLAATAATVLSGVLATAVGAVSTAFAILTSPITIVVAAVAALLYYTGAAGKALTWLKDVFGGLASAAMQALTDIGGALLGGLVNMVSRAWHAAIGWVWNAWAKIKKAMGAQIQEVSKEIAAQVNAAANSGNPNGAAGGGAAIPALGAMKVELPNMDEFQRQMKEAGKAAGDSLSQNAPLVGGTMGIDPKVQQLLDKLRAEQEKVPLVKSGNEKTKPFNFVLDPKLQGMVDSVKGIMGGKNEPNGVSGFLSTLGKSTTSGLAAFLGSGSLAAGLAAGLTTKLSEALPAVESSISQGEKMSRELSSAGSFSARDAVSLGQSTAIERVADLAASQLGVLKQVEQNTAAEQESA